MNRYLLLGNAVMVVAFLFAFRHLPPQIPLFYSKVWGEEQIADLWMILVLPSVMNMFVIANNYITNKYFYENDYIKQLLFYVNICLIAVFTFIFVRVLFLVS